MDNADQRWIVHTGPGMSAKWVGNGPVTNTGGGTGELKREVEGRRVLLMKSKCKSRLVCFKNGEILLRFNS